MSTKRQLVTIGGGDAFSERDNFLKYLKTVPLYNLHGEVKNGWRRGLASQLPEFNVFSLSMPNADNAKYDEWCIWFERYFEHLTHGVILVGHSLGGMFLAKYLIENKTPFQISGLILLASPCGYYDDATGNDCDSFRFNPADVRTIQAHTNQVQIWHSEDDHVVPYSHALEFKKNLPDATLVTFKDKNHFLLEEFPELIEHIKAIG